MIDSNFTQALAEHDARVTRAAPAIWVGSEPTFTLASSEAPEWLSEALGGDKEFLALKLLERLRRDQPGALILRTLGRQYDKEESPRWSFGLYRRRDGQPVWQGPQDPLTHPPAASGPAPLEALAGALSQALSSRGWQLRRHPEGTDARLRLLARADGQRIDDAVLKDPRLTRGSVHTVKTPHDGLRDTLAEEGFSLFLLGLSSTGEDSACPTVELPAMGSVELFLTLVSALEEAAGNAGVSQLMVRGYPPPVDEHIAWTTITPDPAVIEINQAPATDAMELHADLTSLYAAADELGLKPWRAHYNGRVTDSGGGGQVTLGGPTPLDSPFFRAPGLLPRLVRYLNHHPSLSYRFATDYVGPASQSPRPDEGVRDRFRELDLALAQLEQAGDIAPEFLWACLAPFLADSTGNPHRSELNIEKLWNPHLPGRGCLGLVEFRAFRMPHSVERMAALAALVRAVSAMLVQADLCPALRDWGDHLHDRFALPWYLDRDLRAVFAELREHDLGLGAELEGVLLDDPFEPIWRAEYAGVELELRRAIEFWPLVGDASSQESGGSRLVDSSSGRLQISLRAPGPDAPPLADWVVRVGDRQLPLCMEQDEQGVLRLAGLRYREFVPWRGLHPGVAATDPIELCLSHPNLEQALHASLHSWEPNRQPYPGLPATTNEAQRRLDERLVTRIAPPVTAGSGRHAEGSFSDLTLDLRWP